MLNQKGGKMAQKTEVSEKKFNTNVSTWTNTLTDLVTRDFQTCEVPFDEYSKTCAMNAMMAIYQLINDTDKVTLNDLDMSNLREIVGNAASLKLNANAVPRECYFQLRTKKVGNDYLKVVEMGIEGDGNDSLLRNYGSDIQRVYPCWLVKEGDDFTYPKHKGIGLEPPSWEEKGISQKVIRVVYPLLLSDGTYQYLISERDSVKVNLFAHVKNNMLNETFDVLKGTNSKGKPKTKYDATEKEKEEIEAKKQEIFDALRACETVDDMIACPEARPYISPAWLDNPEAMIVRKMRNNATKKYPKNFNSMARQSFNSLDETYQEAQEEIAEEANSEPFDVDVAEIKDSTEEKK